MLTIRSNDFSEKQLAEVALAIQNRWEVPAFVKMHEIVVVDEDVTDRAREELARYFEKGLANIFENLGLAESFEFKKLSKTKYVLERIPGSNLPQWMTDIEVPSRIPEGVYECPHCVPADTLILGDNKPILEYNKGDTAMGQTGLNDVVQTFVRQYEGEMIRIKANGMLPIMTTPEHPILASTSRSIRRREGHRHLSEILFSKERWLAAKDVVPKTSHDDGNYVVIPIIKGNFDDYQVSLFPFIKKHKPHHKGYRQYFPLSEDTAWLLGLYTAEGSISKEVRFSLNSNEQQINTKIKEIALELGYSTYARYIEDANSMLVTISSRVLSRAFDEWCGHKAPNKKIPDFILYHKGEEILRAFLRGYEIGDSYDATNKSRGNKVYRTSTTTSRILAQQLQLAYARLGKWAGIYVKREATEGIIIGRKCSFHCVYFVSYPLESNIKRQKVRFVGDKVLSPVRHVTRESYNGNVYNIGTDDNTYLVSNAIVHNCGKWFKTDLELSMHTKLHYLV